ncbi:MAG: carbohydrate ABC transporter permease [Halanaerobiaceae bacterium]
MKVIRSLLRKRDNYGYIFIAPFLLGFLLFFLFPFIMSIRFSLSDIIISSLGYELEFVGLEHYDYILFVDAEFVETLTTTIVSLLTQIPMILFFSFFAAIILNQKFKGRMFARVIFFLPVIMAAGIVLKIEQQDLLTEILNTPDLASAGGGSSGGFVFSDASVRFFFQQMSLPPQMINYLMTSVDNLAEIIRSSGVQILIFLAGLQSISPTLYEAADVEGATAWENFWMITFPLMTPLILTNIVYTIIDSFTRGSNELMILIQEVAFGGAGYSVSVAMSWFYFLIIGIILVVTIKLVSKGVFYRE